MPTRIRKNSVLGKTTTEVEEGVESWLPVELGEFKTADDDIRSSMPAGVGDHRIHPAAERPAEGWFAGDAEFWVVVGENGDRVLIAGVNPAPGDPDGFVVRNVELCGPNFVDNP